MADETLDGEQGKQTDGAKPAGRGLFRIIKAVAFVSVIVVVEVVVASMITPTAQETEKLAQELAAAAHGEAAAEHDEHAEGETHTDAHNLREVELGSYNVTRFNPATNTRGAINSITSHSGSSFPATSVASGDEILALVRGHEVVGVDEIFLLPGGVAAVRQLMAQHKKIVVATLDMDSEGRVWEPVAELLGIAEEVVKCPAVCALCKRDAYYTFRRGDAPAQRILVGAADFYEPRCFSCWSTGQQEKRASAGPGSLYGDEPAYE